MIPDDNFFLFFKTLYIGQFWFDLAKYFLSQRVLFVMIWQKNSKSKNFLPSHSWNFVSFPLKPRFKTEIKENSIVSSYVFNARTPDAWASAICRLSAICMWVIWHFKSKNFRVFDLWTFISLFYLDFHIPFLFVFFILSRSHFGLFGYYWGIIFEKKQVTKFAFCCFKPNGKQLYQYDIYEFKVCNYVF